MPAFDGRGPLGQGPLTGRGLGRCNPNTNSSQRVIQNPNRGLGRGLPPGGGRGLGRFVPSSYSVTPHFTNGPPK